MATTKPASVALPDTEDLPLITSGTQGSDGSPLKGTGHTSAHAAGPGRRGGRLVAALRHLWHHEPLLLATLAGVGLGVVLGVALSFADLPSRAPGVLELLALPGDLLMRTLKMLVLPLITASVMAGVCALRQSTADMGKVARYTLLYYLGTTLGAVALGIVLVSAIRPGRGSPFDALDSGVGCHAANAAKVASHASATSGRSPAEALLGVVRSAFPDNIFAAAASMNVLGIITVSLLFGAALSVMGPEAAPMVQLIGIFNDAIGKIVGWVIWTSPVGIASLILTSICRACNLTSTLVALGLFIVTVLLGLGLWAGLALPALFWATTRRNPAAVYRGFSQAMATAFGTDSSNATLPITMRSAVELGCDPRIVQFFLPLGTTVNMNGTALYEAITVIFIAQAHGVALGFAGTLIVALTATLAAVGAAGIPSAGLVTMLMVLQAVELEQFAGDIAIILAVDWFLDRCRTVVNVLGDAFGTVIIDHHSRKWIPPAGGDDTGGGATFSDAAAVGTAPGLAGGGGGIELQAATAVAAGGRDRNGSAPSWEERAWVASEPQHPTSTSANHAHPDPHRASHSHADPHHPPHSHGPHHGHGHGHGHGGGLLHLLRPPPEEGVRQGLLEPERSASLEEGLGVEGAGAEGGASGVGGAEGPGGLAGLAGAGLAGAAASSAVSSGSRPYVSLDELHHRHPTHMAGPGQGAGAGTGGGGGFSAAGHASPAWLGHGDGAEGMGAGAGGHWGEVGAGAGSGGGAGAGGTASLTVARGGGW
ncbi:hypothetical protein HYH03_010658 [Edaphochlamys debaryana]|uniref:Amino acid transporter n=1 Tax=Edaphochlamys debaryana TaxID=47281 RepID=A0A835Y1T6_9CHLO|nr:hypothetical protein HYH03_010658 [Edaphochlamys debaryana]|eukprot:KAG2490985.1 hypothetical protein HYH03_010658 [Edaphochlamys debaryana]